MSSIVDRTSQAITSFGLGQIFLSLFGLFASASTVYVATFVFSHPYSIRLLLDSNSLTSLYFEFALALSVSVALSRITYVSIGFTFWFLRHVAKLTRIRSTLSGLIKLSRFWRRFSASIQVIGLNIFLARSLLIGENIWSFSILSILAFFVVILANYTISFRVFRQGPVDIFIQSVRLRPPFGVSPSRVISFYASTATIFLCLIAVYLGLYRFDSLVRTSVGIQTEETVYSSASISISTSDYFIVVNGDLGNRVLLPNHDQLDFFVLPRDRILKIERCSANGCGAE